MAKQNKKLLSLKCFFFIFFSSFNQHTKILYRPFFENPSIDSSKTERNRPIWLKVGLWSSNRCY
uniref:Uncharacterized protein n=1 Tax=Lepeophtheirus salmonis TaxID=72036 RepID=A0A0K2T364_LEPSM